MLDESGQTLHTVAATGADADAVARHADVPVDAPLAPAEVVRTGRPDFLTTRDDVRNRFDALLDVVPDAGAVAVLPLTAGDAPPRRPGRSASPTSARSPPTTASISAAAAAASRPRRARAPPARPPGRRRPDSPGRGRTRRTRAGPRSRTPVRRSGRPGGRRRPPDGRSAARAARRGGPARARRRRGASASSPTRRPSRWTGNALVSAEDSRSTSRTPSRCGAGSPSRSQCPSPSASSSRFATARHARAAGRPVAVDLDRVPHGVRLALLDGRGVALQQPAAVVGSQQHDLEAVERLAVPPGRLPWRVPERQMPAHTVRLTRAG